MAEVTYYVVQPFVPLDDGDLIVPGAPVQVPTLHAARCAVAKLTNGAVGAFAFSRSGDPEEGEWADAEIVAENGRIPLEYLSSGLPW